MSFRLVQGDAWVDVEAVSESIQRAEAAVARAAWAEVWGPGRVALHVVRRDFLPGEDAPWIAAQRHVHDDIELRALECIAEASLEVGPHELESAGAWDVI